MSFRSLTAAQAVAHRQRVTSLYRNSLKTLLSWAADRDIFFSEAEKIRQRFDANRNISDLSMALDKVKQGERELAEHRHPDPYIREYP